MSTCNCKRKQKAATESTFLEGEIKTMTNDIPMSQLTNGSPLTNLNSGHVTTDGLKDTIIKKNTSVHSSKHSNVTIEKCTTL